MADDHQYEAFGRVRVGEEGKSSPVYAWAGRRWDLTPGVIEAWVAATVVQVVGVVAIVTRHLFPNRDGREVSA